MQVTTQFFTLSCLESDPWKLKKGGFLKEALLAYETFGELNSAKNNAILVFHALTGSQHIAGYNPTVNGVAELWTDDCHIGWWDDFVGPAKALDTNRFFVICCNYLGGCYGSTGPRSIDPDTGRPYGGSFPWITLADIVDSQVKLLDHLGIDTLHAVVGGSLGGMMCLSLATRYPERVRLVIPIATGANVTILQRILNFEQICAIEFDPEFRSGDYYGYPGPEKGLALARIIGHKTFVSLDMMAERARQEVIQKDGEFGQYRLTHSVESYMLHQGNKFVKRFDANAYLCLMGVWQSVDLLSDANCNDFVELFSRCRNQHFMIFSIDSDVCFYPQEQKELVLNLRKAKVPWRHITVHSLKGHDSFLLEPELFAPHLRDTLSSTC
ncbi:MAG: homoserine O-acetyltransferase [SAR324 cluster bacterium]|uniref:Homoserine O-acetyltransferase n=1 Tax=SAR324 cluster bacterium TaxID=2024889 RepID=A0A7X9FPY1_9DELT|nr:homoserine O-acetyltransferase [SAR324 cluster bacterium]